MLNKAFPPCLGIALSGGDSMQQHDLDALNLDTVRKPRGRSRFLEDDPPTSVEYEASISVMPPDTKRTSSASVVFAFLFLVLAGVGGALVYYGDQATDLIRAWALPGSTGKPTAPPEGFAELQQQLKSIATESRRREANARTAVRCQSRSTYSHPGTDYPTKRRPASAFIPSRQSR